MAFDAMQKALTKNGRVSASRSGYMELAGAKKDADCSEVAVKGGVSRQLGCCNLFKYRSGAEKLFSCGTCKYVTK